MKTCEIHETISYDANFLENEKENEFEIIFIASNQDNECNENNDIDAIDVILQ